MIVAPSSSLAVGETPPAPAAIAAPAPTPAPSTVVPTQPKPPAAAPAPALQGAPMATNAPAGSLTNPIPLDPAVAQLDFANGLFARQFYDMALVEYLKFREKNDNHPLADEAYYRMGECQRELKLFDQAKESFRALTRRWPASEYSGRAHFRLGEMEYAAKDLRKAAPCFLAALHQSRDEAVRTTAQFYLAKVQLEADQPKAALENFREVLKSKSGEAFRPYAESAVAGIYLKLGDQKNALTHYENLLKFQASPEVREEALYQVGALRYALQLYPAAAMAFREFLKEFGRSRSVMDAGIGLARSLYASGQRREAATVAREWYNAVPNEVKPEMAMMVAMAFRDEKAYKEAADWLAKTNSPEARAEMVRCAFLAGDHPRTVQLGEALMQAEPNNAFLESVLLLVAEAHEALKQWEPAARTYRLLLERYPKTKWVADALWHAATCWQEIKRPNEAVKEFERVAKEFPKDPRNEVAWYQLAVCNGLLDKTEAMIAAFDKLQSLYPKGAYTAEAHYWIGAHVLTQKQWAKAAEHLEAALAMRPADNRIRARSKLVMAYFQLNNVQKAAEHVRALTDVSEVKLVPAEILTWLGEKTLAADRPEPALVYLKQALNATTDPAIRLRANEAAATAHTRLGQWDQAAAYYRDVIETEGATKRGMAAAVGLSEALLHMRMLTDAKDTLEKLLERHPEGPENARIRMLLGDLYVGLGDHHEAAKYYMSVAVLYDDRKISPEALDRAARAFEACGRTGDAAQARRELNQRFPTYQMFSNNSAKAAPPATNAPSNEVVKKP
ncbi:MAG: tetratricopeptide repeat protein [Verrucomicrobia bacterium]|nr:tetratricopeptide repeat protein [Verrucomicrobiota bacterium]